MIERTIAWLTRGDRKLGCRGRVEKHARLHLRVAAINLGRLTTMGLTGTNGSWALT